MKINFKSVVVMLTLILGVSSVAAQDISLKHCALELAPVIGQFDPSNPRFSTVVREGCFESFAEAVSFATRGRIDLPANSSDADVIAAVQRDMQTGSTSAQRGGGITPQSVYTLAYMYDWSNYQTDLT